MLSRRVILRILINTAIGAGLLFLWLKLVNIEEVWHKLTEANLNFIFLFIVSLATTAFFRALRLKLLLNDPQIPLKNVVFLTYLAQLLNFSIPIRAGEIGKGVYLSTQYNIPFPKALIWILVDRFIDFWLVLVLALILILTVPNQLPANLKTILAVMIIGFSVATILIVFYTSLAKRLVNFSSKLLILSILKKYFTRICEYIIDTVSILRRSPRQLSVLALVTMVALAVEGLGWLVLFTAFDKVQFLPILLGSLFNALSYLIPAAPGYVGSAEAAGLVVFNVGLGFDKTLVSAATVLGHVLTLVYMLVFGITSLYALNFNLSLVWRKIKREESSKTA